MPGGIQAKTKEGTETMKRIVQGKLIDTEKCKTLAKWDNGRSYNDFAWCAQELIRTRSGLFVLVGNGGALSIYAHCSGESSVGRGEGMEILSKDGALQWLEEKNIDMLEIAEDLGLTVE